jgi:two-component system sensor histidine kinase AlgZ
MDDDGEIRGLWHERPRQEKGLRRFVTPASLVIYLLVPLFLLVLPGGGRGPDLPRLLVNRYLQNFIVVTCIGGLIHFLYGAVWPRLITRPPSRLLRGLAHGSTVVGGVVIGGEVASRIVSWAWNLPLTHLRPIIMRVGLFVSLSIVATLLVYDGLRAQARRLQIREERARLAAVQAELRALQARTNPHFLFNSLNSVAGLIPEDPERAELMLEKLSAVFRYALEGSRRQTVTLAEEIAAVSTYLSVEAIRFGERLATRMDIDLDPAVQQLLVPPFVLQPLVENAVLHGVAPRREKVTVHLQVARRGNSVVLTVEDDSQGAVAVARPPGSRSALPDLQERLRLLYGPAAALSHGSRTPHGYRAEVVLPLEAPAGA